MKVFVGSHYSEKDKKLGIGIIILTNDSQIEFGKTFHNCTDKKTGEMVSLAYTLEQLEKRGYTKNDNESSVRVYLASSDVLLKVYYQRECRNSMEKSCLKLINEFYSNSPKHISFLQLSGESVVNSSLTPYYKKAKEIGMIVCEFNNESKKICHKDLPNNVNGIVNQRS